MTKKLSREDANDHELKSEYRSFEIRTKRKSKPNIEIGNREPKTRLFRNLDFLTGLMIVSISESEFRM